MKKTQYKYYTGVGPPAPFVHVSLGAPGVPAQLTGQPAHIDTGAYKSVIPLAWADQLGLLRVREVSAQGLDGVVVVLPTYLVEVTVKDFSPVIVEVLASPGEPFVLLGRDILNRYRIVLAGPNRELVVEEP